MADTNLADQIMMQSQRSMEAMTRDAPRPVLSKAAKEEAARHAQADRVLKAPITKGRDVRQFHGFSMRVDHERYSPWPGGQHGGDGGFKLCLNRPTREPRPAPSAVRPHGARRFPGYSQVEKLADNQVQGVVIGQPHA